MKKKKTPVKGGNKRTAVDKPSDNNEENLEAKNCEICEAIKEGKFSSLVADSQNETPVHNNGINGLNNGKMIKNGLNTTTLPSSRNYSSYAAKILQLQKKISQQVLMGLSINIISRKGGSESVKD